MEKKKHCKTSWSDQMNDHSDFNNAVKATRDGKQVYH